MKIFKKTFALFLLLLSNIALAEETSKVAHLRDNTLDFVSKHELFVGIIAVIIVALLYRVRK